MNIDFRLDDTLGKDSNTMCGNALGGKKNGTRYS